MTSLHKCSDASISYENVRLGFFSLFKNVTGIYNTSIGSNSLLFNNEGPNNTSFGAGSLMNNNSGNSNVALGSNSMTRNTDGNFNTCIGTNSNIDSSDVYNNSTAIGRNAQIIDSDQIVFGEKNYNGEYPVVECNDLNVDGTLFENGTRNIRVKYIQQMGDNSSVSKYIDISDINVNDTDNYTVVSSIYYGYSGSGGTYNAINTSSAISRVVISDQTSSGFTYSIKKTTGDNVNVFLIFTIFFK